MNIENRPYSGVKSNPNFTSIRSIKCSGLYKKHPEYGQELVDAFKKSPKAMEFCKKYDVDIVFYAAKERMAAVNSEIHVFFDDISRGKFKRFFDAINGKKEDVTIGCFSNEYDVEKSLHKSTRELIDRILPKSAGTNKNQNGLFDSHLKYADERVQEALDKKAQKLEQIQIKTNQKEQARNKQIQARENLNNSINELIEETK